VGKTGGMKMANTERIQVIMAVRKAKKLVSENRRRDDLTDPQKALLKRLYLLIDNIEDDLILKEVSEHVEKLEAASQGLLVVNEEIKNDIEDIEDVVKAVENAAKGVSVLVKIVTQATNLFV
jgi:hypothetical protein